MKADEVKKREQVLRDLCLREKKDASYWPGLEKPISQKGANRFLLGAIIDYQIPSDKAWDRSEWIAYRHFRGSDDIWTEIAKYSLPEWRKFCRENSVHRFPAAFDRIHRIGNVIRTNFKSDARNIWKNQDSNIVRHRLLDMRFGEQLTNMVLGALYDVGELVGVLDVKADLNVNRVLGRVIMGSEITKAEAIRIARKIFPENPWRLDGALFRIGKKSCKKIEPICGECDFREICRYCS